MSSDLTWPAGYQRLVFDELDSTLDEAARMAPYIEDPAWIIAKRQTAARGRRGRKWATQTGNFAGTLVCRPDEPPATVALRSFVAALAVHDACAVLTEQGDSFKLKWPNDVLLNGGKVAGILLESTGTHHHGVRHLSIGIGVNLTEAPDPSEVEARALPPVSILGETGVRIDAEDFLDQLALAYQRREWEFTGHGFLLTRRAWLQRAARVGEEITARMGNRELTGIFETVDEAGNLVLNTGETREALPAAEVFFS